MSKKRQKNTKFLRRQVNELDYWRENREHVEKMEKLKEEKKKERQRDAQIRKGMDNVNVSSLLCSRNNPNNVFGNDPKRGYVQKYTLTNIYVAATHNHIMDATTNISHQPPWSASETTTNTL